MNRRNSAIVHLLGSLALALVACSSRSPQSGFDQSVTNQADVDGGSGGDPTLGGGGGDDPAPSLGDGGGAAANPNCAFSDSDHDGDGFTVADGDCNDCDPNMNPGAFDVAKDNIDEDCNGKVDDEPVLCDGSLAIDSSDGFNGARAMGLCRKTAANATGAARTWGVVSAGYMLPDGTKSTSTKFGIGHGILSAFGVNTAQEGASMLALSNGTARGPNDPGYYFSQTIGGYDKEYTNSSPAPYPKDSKACPGVVTGQAHDGIAFQMTIRVPTNAKSFTFNEHFFTVEFPEYICSKYNDSFVVMMTPQVAMLADGNIAFDQDSNPISVNNSLLQVCDPQTAGGKSFPCPLGSATLSGTGYEGAAATGWLKTTAPVDTLRGKDITLLFAVWDSGDGRLDSMTLLDNFQWSVEQASPVPTTTPQPPPK